MSGRDQSIGVTGATGFVGRHVVRMLVDAGWSVRCLVRDRNKAQRVLPAPVREEADGPHVSWVMGDIEQPGALGELAQNCWGVVHCIGIRRELAPEVTFRKQHVFATRAVVEAAEQAGAKRFIHISALGTRPEAACAYHKSKFESESIVRQSGLDWTILRPSLIHGPDGELMQMIKGWALGRNAPWLFMPYFARAEISRDFPPRPPKPESAEVQPIFVEDVALAVVRSLVREASIGEVYALGGSEALDWPALLGEVRDAIPLSDGKKRIIPVPGALAAIKARAMESLGMGALLPFGPSEPVMAMEDSVCSMNKAREHLGLEARDFTETMRSYAALI